MRYIGSKFKLLDKIQKVIDENITEQADTFLDLFSGTCTVVLKRN